MSINHSQTGTGRDFSIGNRICRSMLLLRQDCDWHKNADNAQPDALAFAFAGENIPLQLKKWRQSSNSTLPFLLCISARQDHDAFAEQLTLLMAEKPHGLILTDVKNRADGERLDAMLRVEEAMAGMADGSTKFLVLLGGEPAGFAQAVELAHCSSRLVAIGQDSDAIIAATGAKTKEAADPVLNATRSAIQLAAASARIPAFEVLAGNSKDMAETLINRGLRMLTTDAPDQLAAINSAFDASGL